MPSTGVVTAIGSLRHPVMPSTGVVTAIGSLRQPVMPSTGVVTASCATAAAQGATAIGSAQVAA